MKGLLYPPCILHPKQDSQIPTLIILSIPWGVIGFITYKNQRKKGWTGSKQKVIGMLENLLVSPSLFYKEGSVSAGMSGWGKLRGQHAPD